MIIDGENIIVSTDMNKYEVMEFYNFIKERLEYIETVTVEMDDKLATAMLLQLLSSIKKSKSSIKIDILESNSAVFDGNITMKWVQT